jgi:aspartate 1-decarboxylase
MTIEILKSKVKNVKVTTSNINDNGVIKISEELLELLTITENERLIIFNEKNNKEFTLFAEAFNETETPIKDMFEITCPIYVGGAGDHLSITSMTTINIEDAKEFKPYIITHNQLVVDYINNI